tara:strand:+ start:332 stop:1375 length:1044 start_codon:yes stop_codon:yes gene_type:complete
MKTITINPGSVTFEVNEEETILSAALRNGLIVPYGCKDGACGSCKAKITDGSVDYGLHQRRALSEFEKSNQSLLLCTARPLTNLEITANVLSISKEYQAKKLPCRIETIKKVTEDVCVISLKLPGNQKFSFLPGQYIDLLLEDGKRRSYSMANAPNDDNVIELHIKHNPGGLFTDPLFGFQNDGKVKVVEKKIFRLEGPLGTFYFRKNIKKKIIFLASGTGIGPIKAIVEGLLLDNAQYNIALFWGVRKPKDLYLTKTIENWSEQIQNFSYIPVVSEATIEDNWKGRTGFVHHALMEDYSSLEEYAVYACGSPLMVSAAFDDLTKNSQLGEKNFFSDAFTVATDAKK